FKVVWTQFNCIQKYLFCLIEVIEFLVCGGEASIIPVVSRVQINRSLILCDRLLVLAGVGENLSQTCMSICLFGIKSERSLAAFLGLANPKGIVSLKIFPRKALAKTGVGRGVVLISLQGLIERANGLVEVFGPVILLQIAAALQI